MAGNDRIADAEVGVVADISDFRTNLKYAESLFHGFVRDVRTTKAVADIKVNTKSLIAAIGVKKMFDKAMARTPGTFFQEMSKMTLRIGPFTASLSQAMTLLIGFGPIIQGLVGALGSFAGLLGSAAAGLGALGAAAGGAALVGLGGVMALLPALLKDFKNLNTLQDAYHKQVLKTGAGSEKAKEKLEEFNHALGTVQPSTRAAFQELGKIQARFRGLVKDARPDFMNAMGSAIDAVGANFSRFRTTTLANFAEVSRGFQAWMRGLQTAEAGNIFKTLGDNARLSIRPIMDALGNLITFLGRVAAAASRYLPSVASGFRLWSEGLADSAADSDKLDSKLATMFSRLTSVGNLLRSFGSLMKTIFSGGAQEGQNMADTLTQTFNRWNAFLKTPVGQNKLKEFFADARETVSALGPALVNIVGALSQFATAVQPITTAMLGAVAAVGKFFGLVQRIPGVGPILAQGLAFALLAQRVGLLVPAIRGIIAIAPRLLALMGGPITLALVAFGTALVVAYKKSETFRNIVNTVASAVRDAFVSMVTDIMGAFSSFLGGVAKVADAVGADGLAKKAREAQNGIDNFRKSIVEATGAAGSADRKMQDLKKALNDLPDRKTIEVVAGVTVKESNANKAAQMDDFANARGDGPGKRIRGAIARGTQRIANKAVQDGRIGMGLPPIAGGQGLMGAGRHMSGFAAIAGRFGLRVSSGLRPGDNDSYHGSGEALDLAAPMTPEGKRAMLNVAKLLASRYGGSLNELIYTPLGFSIKDGKKTAPYATADHYDHVHVAVDAGSAGKGRLLGGGVGAGMGRRGDGWGMSARVRRSQKGDGWGKSKRAQAVIAAAARKYGIDPAILWGLYGAESRFGQNMGPSSAGARGPFQFMPGTAKSYGIDPMNFKQAAFAAAKYLATYKKRGTAGMLAAYNAGPAGNPNNPETQKYIPEVKRLAGTWPGGAGGTTTGTTGDDPTVGGLDPREEKEKRKLEAKIKRNKATLRKLRDRLAKAPRGKKGASARRALQDQIRRLNNANEVMRESIQALGGGESEGVTNTAENRVSEAETGLSEAQSTPALKDDVAAVGALEQELDAYRSERQARLKTVTGFLSGKLSKDERAKYLREKQTIQRTITSIQNKKNQLGKTAAEAFVGQKFGGGAGEAGIAEDLSTAELTTELDDDIAAQLEQEKYLAALLKAYQGKRVGGTAGKRGAWGRTTGGTKGRKFKRNPKLAAQTAAKLANLREQLAKTQFQNQMNPLDYYLAQAESTVGLGDDIGVMNQQLALWHGELARQSKKRNWAGMAEAQNAINSLQQRIQSAVVQQQTDDINNSLDSMQLELRDASNSISLWDDVNSLNRNIYYLSVAQQKAAHYGHWQRYNELAVEIRENQKRVREATWAAEEAPMEARRALAALTDTKDDDKAATQDLLRYAEGRLAWAKAAGDFGEITKQAGIIKGLRDELNAEETNRIESIRMLSERRAEMYRTMGSNQVSGGLTPVGTNVIVNNYYKSMPMDAHTWSRDLSFEIRAAS